VRLQINPSRTGRQTARRIQLDAAAPAVLVLLSTRRVTRKSIHPPVPDADKIQGVEMDDFDANEFKEKSRELQKIFVK
jgi:hypothetical protein